MKKKKLILLTTNRCNLDEFFAIQSIGGLNINAMDLMKHMRH